MTMILTFILIGVVAYALDNYTIFGDEDDDA